MTRWLNEHNPAPAGDPEYVPWWARGEYASTNGTRYTTESGTIIRAGAAVSGASEGGVPVNALADPAPKRPVSGPWDDSKLSTVCSRIGVPDSLWRDAPNRGVGVMRVKNAARRAGVEL